MLAQLEINEETFGLPEGYGLRGATLDDLPEAVEMFNAYSRELIGTDEFTFENYEREWQIPLLNLPEDVHVVISPEGRIVGCMEVWDLFEPHTRINTWGRVHPDHQGRGIATALLRWAETRARRAILHAPDSARVAMLNWVNSVDTAAHDVLTHAGFSAVRHSYHMRIDMTGMPIDPVWPAGITLRTCVPGEDVDTVAYADREAFRDHWGYVERPFEQEVQMVRHFMTEPLFDPSLWFIAMNGDQVAGVCLCRPKADDEPDTGWVDTLGVLRSYRRQGLGLALLRHAFGEFYRRGIRKAGLGVDAQSLTGATRLYERAGMRVYRQFYTYEKELRSGVDLSTQTAE